ncbi:FAD-dependent oxidoreductase [Egicoccus sp. AB-alg2]|uniref:FAD-dependent oxidoreductase n=1 Tax=Egicoccus sp. AB-alg2 TaxID=3242693 RepID=UPI00359F0E92
MTTGSTVLVVGGGFAGCAAATFLARQGAQVDVVEIRDDVPRAGSGITVQGNALRVLRELGVWEDAEDHGYAFTTLGMRTPDGHLVAEFEDVRTGGPDLPATLGMERPTLARILADAAREAGASLRFGLTVTSLEQDAAGVQATFSDGATGQYDLVVGADGVNSAVREMIGIETGPKPLGMGIWRVFIPRPESIQRTELAYGGRCFIAGFCPTAEDSMYAYLVEEAEDRSNLTPDRQRQIMEDLAASYGGPWNEIRPLISAAEAINYTWFESHVIDGPWHRGRVVLIGDAAHSCPPTLAQGAAMALEDAQVLGQEIEARGLDKGLAAFVERRRPRVEQTVAASVQLCTWLIEGTQDADVPGLIGRTMGMLKEPA